ncbi:flagellar hook assembly protein FlgD [Deinococcus puniceus]|uniref:FlgD Ig-like domain-containing protein n=1 Tax=Deinococcus puniceus TaxID=1182568 RepID=A0A172T8I0_9DEIO|nr:hypothetical protein [Deinococcus puniceus]ANE43335.1 hypothetical protein SU48_05650 [Deinococcus puniceus]
MSNRTPVKLLTMLALSCAVLGAGMGQAIDIKDIPALPPTRTATPAPTTPLTPAPTAPTTPAVSAPTTLPTTGNPLTQPYRAALVGPSTLTPGGEPGVWTLQLTNTGTAEISIDHGACDLRFEVLNAAGQIVRPDPKNGICTLQMILTRANAGETINVLKINWDGKNGAGQALPAGQYTIRSAFKGQGYLIRPADVRVTLK